MFLTIANVEYQSEARVQWPEEQQDLQCCR